MPGLVISDLQGVHPFTMRKRWALLHQTSQQSSYLHTKYILNRKELVSSLVINDLCRVGQFKMRKLANSVSPDKSAIFLLIAMH